MKDSYITFVIARFIASNQFNDLVGADWIAEEQYASLMDQTAERAFQAHGIIIPPAKYRSHTESMFDALRARNAIHFDGDDYTGNWIKFDFARKEIATNAILADNTARNRVRNLGPESLTRALRKIVAEDGLTFTDESSVQEDLGDRTAPAVDRIVSFDHNSVEVAEIDQGLEQVSEVIRGDNDGSVVPRLERLRIIEQFRAARDLLKVGRVSTKTITALLMPTLVYLASKFGEEAVGQLAARLIDALSSLFGLG